MSPTQLECGKPTKSSEKFVVGRSHEFVESDVKFRIPPVCAYCSVIIQRKITACVQNLLTSQCTSMADPAFSEGVPMHTILSSHAHSLSCLC